MKFSNFGFLYFGVQWKDGMLSQWNYQLSDVFILLEFFFLIKLFSWKLNTMKHYYLLVTDKDACVMFLEQRTGNFNALFAWKDWRREGKVERGKRNRIDKIFYLVGRESKTPSCLPITGSKSGWIGGERRKLLRNKYESLFLFIIFTSFT